MRVRFLIGLGLLLAGCGLGETPGATPLPLTVNAPPPVVVAGDCNLTPELEAWLQTSVQLREDFRLILDTAQAQPRADVRDSVLRMIELRDALNATVTPDCAQEAQLLLSTAMGQAITVFQEFNNGTRDSIGSVVNEVSVQIEAAGAIQDELQIRMDQQYRDRAATLQAQMPPATPTP
jgi:hypothetical protein